MRTRIHFNGEICLQLIISWRFHQNNPLWWGLSTDCCLHNANWLSRIFGLTCQTTCTLLCGNSEQTRANTATQKKAGLREPCDRNALSSTALFWCIGAVRHQGGGWRGCCRTRQVVWIQLPAHLWHPRSKKWPQGPTWQGGTLTEHLLDEGWGKGHPIVSPDNNHRH